MISPVTAREREDAIPLAEVLGGPRGRAKAFRRSRSCGRYAHAGKDRMPLGARLPLHVFTVAALEHRGLTPWLRFDNMQSVHGLETEAEIANEPLSMMRPVRSRSTKSSDPGPQSVGGLSMISAHQRVT
jgi:hypothetical protein